MPSSSITLDLLARAVDVSALRQSVYTANIANAGVSGYRRMEVAVDREMQRVTLQIAGTRAEGSTLAALADRSVAVIDTGAAVKLDEEMGLMAKNALRYQLLLSAFDKTMGPLRAAVHEGRK